ncbi:MAG: o-succinylbenzoate synthase [Pirellulales bacterium]|nr:o-succinylbenzoate synthase [Pirellulales bacterium]
MRIDAIELFHVRMPLLEPWRTAYGEDAAAETVLARIAGDGATAWAESTPLAAPTYSPEWAGGVFAVARDWFAPALVGQRVGEPADVQTLLAHFKGNPFAKGLFDAACWMLTAELARRPLHELLGGARTPVEVGADFGVRDSIGDLLAAVAGAQAAGFTRVKLKIRRGWDLNVLRAVRQEFPALRIHVDCNGGYTLADMELLCRLDDFALAMIEQPLDGDDLVDHAHLQQQIRTPICLDESITSPRRAELAIELGSCRVINIKPGRVGGLTPALEILAAAREAGLDCWVGGMLESAIGARMNLALATCAGFTYPADLFPSARFFAQDLARPALEFDTPTSSAPGGEATAPPAAPSMTPLEVPGTGAAPDAERLEAWTVARACVSR